MACHHRVAGASEAASETGYMRHWRPPTVPVVPQAPGVRLAAIVQQPPQPLVHLLLHESAACCCHPCHPAAAPPGLQSAHCSWSSPPGACRPSRLWPPPTASKHACQTQVAPTFIRRQSLTDGQASDYLSLEVAPVVTNGMIIRNSRGLDQVPAVLVSDLVTRPWCLMLNAGRRCSHT